MYIRFNYRCSTCGHEEDRFIKKEVMDRQYCFKCDSTEYMLRLPAAPRTTFRFHDKKLKD